MKRKLTNRLAPPKDLAIGYAFDWLHTVKGKIVTTPTAVVSHCPFCAMAAVTPLPEAIRAKQPDNTSHVCNPYIGGCNHGFTMEGE